MKRNYLPATLPSARTVFWLLPILAGGLTLAGLIFFVHYVNSNLLWQPSPPATSADVRGGFQEHVREGRRELAQGHFQLASREFLAAEQLRERGGPSVDSLEERQLIQLRKQADLLSRLLGHSLQEVLQEALTVRRDDEWQARFEAHYKGKSVLFDDTVQRDALGRPTLSTYAITVDKEQLRIALEDLKLLGQLPLEQPRRMLIGARIARLEREPGGGWVVHFEPESAVLLTDSAAVDTLVPGDDELDAVLKRQQEWLDGLNGGQR